ncbi:MAG: NusG domain II-containing protein [Clostridia bacterium]|nr:NusG domain II-containing protein [Clostridia bacterium]
MINKIKKGDIIVFIGVILLILLISVITFPKSDGDVVEITVNEKTTTYSLFENVTIETNGEYNNVVVIKDKKVRVSDARCPDKVCKNTGEISKKGQSIICVPEKMIIKIKGGGKIDGIAN